MVFIIPFFLATLIPSALSYSAGAPPAACSTLTPSHGVTGQDPGTSPYRINTEVFRDTRMEGSGELLYTPGFTYNGKAISQH